MPSMPGRSKTFGHHGDGQPAGGCLARVKATRDGFLTGDVTDPQTREEAVMLLREIYKRG